MAGNVTQPPGAGTPRGCQESGVYASQRGGDSLPASGSGTQAPPQAPKSQQPEQAAVDASRAAAKGTVQKS